MQIGLDIRAQIGGVGHQPRARVVTVGVHLAGQSEVVRMWV
jgi:hypothetical protein